MDGAGLPRGGVPALSKGKKPAGANKAPAHSFNWRFLFRSPGTRRGLALCAAIGLFGFALHALWQHYGPIITRSSEYRLEESRIELTQQPPYIHHNVKRDAIQAGGLAELSILDPKLTEKVRHAFGLQTWVASVDRVTKYHPARVVVEVTYRRPVAMVVVTAGEERGLLPVDAAGVLLPPEDFSANQVRNYLRIDVGATQPEGLVGTPWGDNRVAAAAGIAANLDEVWQKLQLYRIVSASAKAGEVPTAPSFDLLTRDGVKVIWGHAPGQEASGEATASEKLAQLLAIYEQQGPLVSTGEPREINVRDGQRPAVPAAPASFRK